MFCPRCGINIPDDSKFCYNCGNQNDKNMPIFENNTAVNNTENNDADKTPVPLITVSWILFALCFIDDFIDFSAAIIIDIAAIICAIFLVINKNKTAKINGIIILCIWTLFFIIMVLFSNIY